MCVLYKKALLAAPPGSSEICGTEEGPSARQSQRNPSGHANVGGSKKSPSTALRSTEAKKNEAVEKPGEVATLMSLDAGRVVNLLGSFHELWSLPLQMAVALYLLYLQVIWMTTHMKTRPSTQISSTPFSLIHSKELMSIDETLVLIIYLEISIAFSFYSDIGALRLHSGPCPEHYPHPRQSMDLKADPSSKHVHDGEQSKDGDIIFSQPIQF